MKNKVIVISGGTKGVGRDLVLTCIKKGAMVVMGGRDIQAAASILNTIYEWGGKCTFVETDLKDINSCNKLFQTALEEYGRVDGFVNYAGVTTVTPLATCTEADFDGVMDINFKSTFFCCQHAVNSMVKTGGSIVLMGSTHAWRGDIDRAAYACSKGAILTLSEHIASHYAKYHIRCNVITMGWTPTEGELSLRKGQGMNEEVLREWASSYIPMGRMQETSDYIEGILYLLSDSSAMVTGSNLKINGGLHI